MAIHKPQASTYWSTIEASWVVVQDQEIVKATTDSKQNKSIAPNLMERQITVSPDRYYVGDIT